MGYDAVYVRSGGMEWVNILAKKGQRFNRSARSERGQALYSPAALHQSLLDSIGEQALRVEQPGESYEDKKQLLLDFAKSLLPEEKPAKRSETVSDGRRDAIRTIRQRVANTVATDLKVRFIGDVIRGTEDLVQKAQALRNPGFETFYLLATRRQRNGIKIVNAMAVTSRVPVSSSIFPDDKQWDEGIDLHEKFLQDSKADSYILLHNHPSGDPYPSSMDIRVTEDHAKVMKDRGLELIEHVVINHLTYWSLGKSVTDMRSGQITSTAPDRFAWPIGTEIGQRMDGPSAIAAIGKNIQEAKDKPDLMVGFFLSGQNQVVGTIQGGISEIKALTGQQLQNMARMQGGHALVLHGRADTKQQAEDIVRDLTPMNRSNLLTDVVIETSDGSYVSGEDMGYKRIHSPYRFFG
jgi:hypothetical protein